MEALFIVALVYPMSLKHEWLNALALSWQTSELDFWSWLGEDQLESFLSFLHDPLAMKGALAAACAIAALVAAFAGWLLAPLFSPPRAARKEGPPIWAFASWLAMLGWGALSTLWSPTPPTSREAALWLIVLGLFGFVLLRRGMTVARMRQLAVFLMLLGAPIAVVAAAQATEAFDGVIYNFLLKWPDARNLYGSVLGHNTTVGSFLMMTSVPAAALAIGARPAHRSRAADLLIRTLIGCYLTLALYAMIASQSRAVWLIGPALGLAFGVYALRRAGARRLIGWVAVGAIAATTLIGAQLIDKPWNHLYVKGNPVARRMRDFSIERLQKETRLRILLASLPLVAEKPLTGWGLHSFRFIYPEAQAEYFARRPDSQLGLTVYRTERAHNDFLQTSIEQGAVGLALLLLALGEIARRGIRARVRLPDADKLLHAAFGFTVLSTALHAFVDFPFHIPQLSVAWLVCLPAFASPRPDEAAVVAPPPPESDPSAFRWGHVLRLSGAGAALFSIPLLIYPFARTFQVDVHYNYGNAIVQRIARDWPQMTPSERKHFADRSRERLDAALHLKPHHDHARLARAEWFYYQAAFRRGERTAESIDFINRYAQLGLEDVMRSLATLVYHDSFYKMALCYGLLWEARPDERVSLVELYRRNLEKSIYFAPSSAEALHLYAGYLRGRPQFDRPLWVKTVRAIQHHNPILFLEQYRVPLHRLFEQLDYEMAIEEADLLLEVDPAEPAFHRVLVDSLMLSGDRRRASEASARFQRAAFDPIRHAVHPSHASYARLYDALIAAMDDRENPESWRRVLDAVYHCGGEMPYDRSVLFLLESHALERLGPLAPDRRLAPHPDLSADEWETLLAERRGALFHRWLGRPDLAGPAFRARIERAGRPPEADFWVEYAAWARDTRQQDALDRCRERLRQLRPGHPLLAPGRWLAADPPPIGR
jgi:O-antigen ligase